MIALFIIGLAADAVGPALTILMDRASVASSTTGNTSAGMFAALNDNADARGRGRVAA